MKIFYSLKDFAHSGESSKKFAVTLGIFDGVHRGHQKIAKAVLEKAGKKRLSSLLITFDPHPANVLGVSGKLPLLVSLKHRLSLIKGLGFDGVIALYFDRRVSRMTAAVFIKKILGKIRVKEIIVGKNFFFGRKKSGSLKDLRKFSGIYGYNVSVIDPLCYSGKVVSSTRIRNLILKGDLKGASKLLSRPVTVLGTVVEGRKRGRIIGYPTANINPHHEAIPPSGVYAVKIKLGRKVYKGILNIGIRPTFQKEDASEREPTIEAHIFGFTKNIYARDLEIVFEGKIRDEKKFKSARELKAQIKRDETRARAMLR